jgi:membrane fusion protein (multidrug efflux system)
MSTKWITLALLSLLFAACGDSKKDGNAALNDKKAALEKLKQERSSSDEKIKLLEAEIAKLDSNAAKAANVQLVGIAPVTTQHFKHYIDLRGEVHADDISYISPRGMGGQVKAIYVKAGDRVNKGQLLLKLDDAIVRQQIKAAQEQVNGLKTQLAFAQNIYQRQQNLWNQGIGTEVQLITARTNAEGLESQLRGAQEQVKIAQEQLKTTEVYSDVTGVADVVDVKVGEIFQGATAMGPQIKIVNTGSLKVAINIPENYIARIRRGSPVVVEIPAAGKSYQVTLTRLSEVVEPTQRGFLAEARIPYDAALKPNQLATVRIQDYESANAITVPINVVQTDERGKYVFVMEKTAAGKTVARKKNVALGEVYGPTVEIRQGLTAGETLITEGYQNLYEGQIVGTLN